jgi:hypothetical protein
VKPHILETFRWNSVGIESHPVEQASSGKRVLRPPRVTRRAKRTYKKEEVKTYFLRGRPNLCFLILQGCPYPFATGVSCPVSEPDAIVGSSSRGLSVTLPGSGRFGYGFLRLEKRSQALQGCNLTRNIQVDGAPMRLQALGTFP